jgi:APA family basic amino acid/polyamine antiporter
MRWIESLTAIKSIDQLRAEASAADGHALNRVLGPGQLVLLGIGDIIGAGIFVLAGVSAAQFAGPAILISFVIAAIASGFAALCYAELAAMIPVAGSAYTYAYATLGELPAWMMGCALTLEFAVGPSAVAVGWSGYVTSLLRDFGITISPRIAAAPGTTLVETSPGHWEILANVAGTLAARGIDPAALPHDSAAFNLLASLIVLVMTAVLVVGVQQSARVNAAIVAVKVAVILVFIGAGLAYVTPDNWTPFIPPNAGEFGRFGYSGILRGAAVVFFAFMGFDSVTTAAQETRNPQRDLPIGIFGSLAACALLYMLFALVLTGVVRYTALDVPDPIAVGIDATGARWLSPLIKLGAICGLSSVVLVGQLAQTRIFYTMARDGLLPSWVARVHPRFRTPHLTTMATGLFMALVAGTTPIVVLSEVVSMGTLLTFVIVCLGVIVLRRTQPARPRPFRTPWSPAVPLAGAVICGYLMFGLPGGTWVRLAIWMGGGLAIYLAYGRRHSRLRTADLAMTKG